MEVVQNALHARLVNTPAIVSGISTFQGAPAIFAQFPVPPDADLPYIVIGDAITDLPYDTKTTIGRETLTDIGVYEQEGRHPSLVQRLAEEIRAALHRQPVMVAGYGAFLSNCVGPIVAPTDDQVYGRLVSVRLTMVQE